MTLYTTQPFLVILSSMQQNLSVAIRTEDMKFKVPSFNNSKNITGSPKI